MFLLGSNELQGGKVFFHGSLVPGTWLVAMTTARDDTAAVNGAAQATLVAEQWQQCLEVGEQAASGKSWEILWSIMTSIMERWIFFSIKRRPHTSWHGMNIGIRGRCFTLFFFQGFNVIFQDEVYINHYSSKNYGSEERVECLTS